MSKQKQVDVFVNDKGQPQHLAVQNEHAKVDQPKYRTVCGAPNNGGEVKQMSPHDVQVGCGDCNEQFKMWKEVNG